HQHDLGLAARQLFDLLGELPNRDLVAVSDVEDLADRPGFVNQGYHSFYDVPDVGEAARLRAVAEYRDGLSCECLTHEVRNHHSVLASLPRSHSVKQPYDDDGQLPLLPVGQRQELVNHLAARIRPSVLRRGAQHEIGVLAKWHLGALAVNFGC